MVHLFSESVKSSGPMTAWPRTMTLCILAIGSTEDALPCRDHGCLELILEIEDEGTRAQKTKGNKGSTLEEASLRPALW